MTARQIKSQRGIVIAVKIFTRLVAKKTMSAMLSIMAPNGVHAFNFRARNPSRASVAPANVYRTKNVIENVGVKIMPRERGILKIESKVGSFLFIQLLNTNAMLSKMADYFPFTAKSSIYPRSPRGSS